MSIKFDITGDGEFAEAMEKAMKQFHASTEKVLKKEARNIAKDLGVRVQEEAKGHHIPATGNRLQDSFRQGKVIRSGKNYTVAVTSKAPHYHLYEEGHDLVTHNRKNRWGKGKPGTGRKVGKVYAKKTVGKYMARRSEYSEAIGQELLNSILEDAGFDS